MLSRRFLLALLLCLLWGQGAAAQDLGPTPASLTGATEAELDAAAEAYAALLMTRPASHEESMQLWDRSREVISPFWRRVMEAPPLTADTLRALRGEAEAAVARLDGTPPLVALDGKQWIGVIALDILFPHLQPDVDDADRLYFVGVALDGMSWELPRIIDVLATAEGHEAEVWALARRALFNLAVLERAAPVLRERRRARLERLAQTGELRRLAEVHGETYTHKEFEVAVAEHYEFIEGMWPPEVITPPASEWGLLDVEGGRAELAALAR